MQFKPLMELEYESVEINANDLYRWLMRPNPLIDGTDPVSRPSKILSPTEGSMLTLHEAQIALAQR